jgi:hypothetical protein
LKHVETTTNVSTSRFQPVPHQPVLILKDIEGVVNESNFTCSNEAIEFHQFPSISHSSWMNFPTKTTSHGDFPQECLAGHPGGAQGAGTVHASDVPWQYLCSWPVKLVGSLNLHPNDDRYVFLARSSKYHFL